MAYDRRGQGMESGGVLAKRVRTWSPDGYGQNVQAGVITNQRHLLWPPLDPIGVRKISSTASRRPLQTNDGYRDWLAGQAPIKF